MEINDVFSMTITSVQEDTVNKIYKGYYNDFYITAYGDLKSKHKKGSLINCKCTKSDLSRHTCFAVVI